jgi:hypothetical protein
MAVQERYEPAGQDVVSEEIDGEVIIVNLNNGNYYSLTQSAAVIWSCIARGATIEQLQNRLSSQYSGATGAMNQALVNLIRALEAEQLITRRISSEASQPADPAPAEQLLAREKEAFHLPVFERFTDMEDLLLLDPVHETEGEKGWPHAKEDT